MKKALTIQSVVRDGLCTGCGTCAAICGRDAVRMIIGGREGLYVPTLDSLKCNECGLCLDVCPGPAVDFQELNREFLGKAQNDVALGSYLRCYTGYAADHSVRYGSSSGGLATALLISALEEGMIDGALVTRMREDRPLEPQPFIARTREELVAASKSKYCPVPANVALKELLKAAEGQRFAVVGLPCHIQGVRKAEKVNKRLRRAVTLHVGLFCGHTNTFANTDFILKKYGVAREAVAHLDYRGRGWPGCMVIKLKTGDELTVPHHQHMVWHNLRLSSPARCSLCSDATAELADISLGDAWFHGVSGDEIGRSTVVSRSEVSERLLQNMTSKGRVVLEETSAARIARSQYGALYPKKKATTACMRLFYREAILPGNCLKPDVLDYAYAVTQYIGSTVVLKSRPVRGILGHLPVACVRLLALPAFGIAKIQWSRVTRRRR